MENLGRCKKSVSSKTGLETTRVPSNPHCAVNVNLRKFGATTSPEQSLHHCKVHIKQKLKGRRA